MTFDPFTAYGRNHVPGQIPSAQNLPSLEARTPAPTLAQQSDRPVFTVEGVTRGLLLDDAVERQIWAEVAAAVTDPPVTYRTRLNQLLKYAGVQGEQRRLVCLRAAAYQEHKGGDQNAWETKRRQMVGLRAATPNEEFGEAQGPLSNTTGEPPNTTESAMSLANWMNKAKDYATDTGFASNTVVHADGPGLIEDKDAITSSHDLGPTEMDGLVMLDATNREGYAGDEHMMHAHAQHQLKQAEMTYKACPEDEMDMKKTFGSDKPAEQKDVEATPDEAPKAEAKDEDSDEGEKKPNPFEKKDEDKGDEESDDKDDDKPAFFGKSLSQWMEKAIPGAKDEGLGSAKSETVVGSRQSLPSGVEVSRVEDGGKVAGKGTTSGANGGKASSLSSTAGCGVGDTGTTTPLTADDPKKAGALKSNDGLVEQSGAVEAGAVSNMEAKGNTPGKPEVPMVNAKSVSSPEVGSPNMHQDDVYKSVARTLDEQNARTRASTRNRGEPEEGTIARISVSGNDVMSKSMPAPEADPALRHLNTVDEINKGGAPVYYSQQVAVVAGCRHCGSEMHKAITECDSCGGSRFDLVKAERKPTGPRINQRGLVLSQRGADIDCDNGFAI